MWFPLAFRMRSKGSRFTLGVWGLRVCSLDVAFTSATVRNRPQPSATVRNRSREGRMAVPMVSSAEGVLFGCFKRPVASFPVAGVALRDIQTCFATCRKLFCVAGTIFLRRFQAMHCSFHGRRSTLDVSIVILRGRCGTLDVSCCVFFANRIGRAASSGDKVQIPWQAWHFVRCAKNWRMPRTKHRFWDSKISGSWENSWENVDFEATKCQTWRKFRTKCSFWCSHFSRLGSLVFLWPRRVYRGSCKTSPFQRFPTVKIGGGLARNARFAAPTCLVSSLWFSCGLAVSIDEAAKLLLFEGFQAGCHVFLASMALCDIPTCLITCRACQNWRGLARNSRFSAPTCLVSTLWFFSGGSFTLYTLRSTIYTLDSSLHTLHFTLHTLHFALYTPHSTLYTPHPTFYTLHTPHSTLYTPHSTLYTPLSTLHTSHFTLHTLHFPFHTPHSTLHTLHFPLHTLHFPLHTPHSTLHSTLHNLHFRLLTPHFTLYTPHFTLCTLHSSLDTLHSTLHTLHSALHTPLHFTLYTVHSTLHTLHFTFHTLHFTLLTPHSTLSTLHSTLYTVHSTLYTNSTLHTPHSTLYTLHTPKRWRREAFTQRSFYAQRFSHGSFTQRNFYAEKRLNRASF